MMENRYEELKGYLLDDLPPEKTRELELEILTLPEIETELIIAEQNLIEEYLENALTPEESDLFQRNFLISDDRRQQLELVRELEIASRIDQYEYNPRGKSVIQGWSDFIRTSPAAAFFSVIFSILLVGAGIYLYLEFTGNHGYTRLEAEYARLNQTALERLETSDQYPVVHLVPGISRSDDRPAEVDGDAASDKIFFRLGLPRRAGSNKSFEIRLFKNDKSIFVQRDISVYRNQAGEELRFFLPASILTEGDYRIAAGEVDAEPFIYVFSVK